MKSFKNFINEARNPLRKQDPYIQNQNRVRQAPEVDTEDLENNKDFYTRKLKKIEDRIKNYKQNKALRIELYTLEDLDKQKQEIQQGLDQIDYMITQGKSQIDLPDHRRIKYEPGKKREPFRPVYNKSGIKWFIYPEDVEKYKEFTDKLPHIMNLFFSELKDRRLIRTPAANFIATPPPESASGIFLSHSIKIDPSTLDLTQEKDVKELIQIMLHEYSHLLFKKLPYEFKKPLGIFNRMFIKQIRAFKAQAPAKYKQFQASILNSDSMFSDELKREIGKFTKHPSSEGYAFKNPEELFAESFVFYKAQPQLFKIIINIINKYI